MGRWLAGLLVAAGTVAIQGADLPAPILFVTQVPIPGDFTSIGSVFGNHQASLESVGRGGDLYIRYPDGTLKNLTRAAGYGKTGMQSGSGIAVRQPCVHWSGNKAVFSMVIGAPTRQYQVETYYWQLFEITGFGQNETPVITRVANQPANFNNVSPVYGTDDRIIFTSDRPRTGERHLYPQLDEYEEAPTVTGLWSLNPSSGDLRMLNHAPSGVFSPFVDSFGRVLFTRWDHLQRDQQADADAEDAAAGNDPTYGTFNYSDESASAKMLLNERSEIFPEPRLQSADLMGHTFNQFFPWQINEDGSEEETLNHVGRHEMVRYIQQSFRSDSSLDTFYNVESRYNTNYFENFIQMAEDPARPGNFLGIDAPEFGTHAAGQILSISGAPFLNADLMTLTYLTPRSTKNPVQGGSQPPADHTGLYRNPLPLSDGRLLAVHTGTKTADRNTGTTARPASLYDFRIKLLKKAGSYYEPDVLLTPGIIADVSYYNPDTLVTYSGTLWELDPVEVKQRTPPARRITDLPEPERQVFLAENVDPGEFREFLRARDLAVIVSRNVTTRDHADKEQPYNLRIAGSATQTTAGSGEVYDISHLQLFEGDQIRGTFGGQRSGRRVLAQLLHGPAADLNSSTSENPAGTVRLGNDGSMAAFVPARRAMTWQLTDSAGNGVVRERYWLSFQPGEIRSCASCHGINRTDQAGNPPPTNQPEALRSLLRIWKSMSGNSNQVRITSANLSSTGKLAVQVSAPAAQSFVIETSVNLQSWTPLRTNTIDGSSSAVVDLDFHPAASTGFFRVRSFQ